MAKSQVQFTKDNEYYTPKEFVDRFGIFDYDPATTKEKAQEFGIKNFDMAIIFKDFHTFKRINSIPRENFEELKEYLDSVGIVFSEGIVPINWTAILT